MEGNNKRKTEIIKNDSRVQEETVDVIKRSKSIEFKENSRRELGKIDSIAKSIDAWNKKAQS